MAVFSRDTIELWPVALLAVAAPAVPIAFEVTRSGFTLALPERDAPHGGYQVRLELPAARPAAEAERVPELEYDLTASGEPGAEGDGGGGSTVEIRKAVRLNGADAGADAGYVTIRVGADSTLAIAAGELRALLVRAGREDIAGQIKGLAGSYVEFEELRREGIDVRYDVTADRIAIAL